MIETTQAQPARKLTRRQITIGMTGFIAILLVSSVGAGAFGAFDPVLNSVWATAEESEAPPLPVNLARLEFVDSISETRTYTGSVRAKQRSDIAFELAGKITSIEVDEGDHVELGDTLAFLDTRSLDAQKRVLNAQLEQARSVWDELDAGPRIEKIKSAQADVAAATAEYENAKQRRERRKILVNRNAIPVEEYRQAEFDAKTTKARLDSSKERLAEMEAGTRSEKMSAQVARIRSLEASVEEVEVAIKKSRLVAPYAATVTERYLDPGSIAQPGTPVIKLVAQQNLEAWIGLPVEIANGQNVGDSVGLDVEGQSVAGKVIAKLAEIDPSTRTQTVLYQIDPSYVDQIVSGQLCKIEIVSKVDKSGFWIPNTALNKGVRGLWSVMSVEPDDAGTLRAVKRDIAILKTDSQRVLASGTFASEDQIVIDGVHRITGGQAVCDAASSGL